jgi:hypothetical protein
LSQRIEDVGRGAMISLKPRGCNIFRDVEQIVVLIVDLRPSYEGRLRS